MENLLKEYNLKVTPQRIAILNTIYKYGHINIDTLYNEIKAIYSSISLATIYKNINAMIENNLLVEIKIPYQKSVYEITKQKHSHFICEKCGKIEDFIIDLDEINLHLQKKYHYQISSNIFIVSGVCSTCQTK